MEQIRVTVVGDDDDSHGDEADENVSETDDDEDEEYDISELFVQLPPATHRLKTPATLIQHARLWVTTLDTPTELLGEGEAYDRAFHAATQCVDGIRLYLIECLERRMVLPPARLASEEVFAAEMDRILLDLDYDEDDLIKFTNGQMSQPEIYANQLYNHSVAVVGLNHLWPIIMSAKNCSVLRAQLLSLRSVIYTFCSEIWRQWLRARGNDELIGVNDDMWPPALRSKIFELVMCTLRLWNNVIVTNNDNVGREALQNWSFADVGEFYDFFAYPFSAEQFHKVVVTEQPQFLKKYEQIECFFNRSGGLPLIPIVCDDDDANQPLVLTPITASTVQHKYPFIRQQMALDAAHKRHVPGELTEAQRPWNQRAEELPYTTPFGKLPVGVFDLFLHRMWTAHDELSAASPFLRLFYSFVVPNLIAEFLWQWKGTLNGDNRSYADFHVGGEMEYGSHVLDGEAIWPATIATWERWISYWSSMHLRQEEIAAQCEMQWRPDDNLVLFSAAAAAKINNQQRGLQLVRLMRLTEVEALNYTSVLEKEVWDIATRIKGRNIFYEAFNEVTLGYTIPPRVLEMFIDDPEYGKTISRTPLDLIAFYANDKRRPAIALLQFEKVGGYVAITATAAGSLKLDVLEQRAKVITAQSVTSSMTAETIESNNDTLLANVHAIADDRHRQRLYHLVLGVMLKELMRVDVLWHSNTDWQSLERSLAALSLETNVRRHELDWKYAALAPSREGMSVDELEDLSIKMLAGEQQLRSELEMLQKRVVSRQDELLNYNKRADSSSASSDAMYFRFSEHFFVAHHCTRSFALYHDVQKGMNRQLFRGAVVPESVERVFRRVNSNVSLTETMPDIYFVDGCYNVKFGTLLHARTMCMEQAIKCYNICVQRFVTAPEAKQSLAQDPISRKVWPPAQVSL